ncbi:hypothetical protein [Sporichthya brevicatena]
MLTGALLAGGLVAVGADAAPAGPSGPTAAAAPGIPEAPVVIFHEDSRTTRPGPGSRRGH